MTDFPPAAPAMHHIRDHRSLVAGLERRLLVWLARRMPLSVTSDHLSLLGLTSMMAVGASFAAVRLTPWSAAAVIGALAANWFGDSLDGTVARVRGQERPRYGFYVDHVLDLAGTTCLFAGLACSGRMSPIVALALLSAYLLVSAQAFLATHSTGRFQLSFLGVGPTELRIFLAVGAVWMIRKPWVSIAGLAPVRPFDLGGIVAIAALAITFAVSASRNARTLYLAEPSGARTGSKAA